MNQTASYPKPLPASVEDERAMIAQCVLDPAAVGHVLLNFSRDDFSRPLYRNLYTAVEQLEARGITDFSPLDLHAELRGIEERAEVYEAARTTLTEISEITNGIPPMVRDAKLFRTTAARVRKHGDARAAIAALNKATMEVWDSPLEATDALNTLEEALERLRRRSEKSSPWTPLSSAVDEQVQYYEQLAAGRLFGIPTGFPELDEKLSDGGLPDDDTTILAARTSYGKAQPLDARILTPSGFVTMGEVHVGMRIIGSDGKPHAVVGVYPRGELDVYRVTTNDGQTTEACGEHLWLTKSWSESRTRSTGSVKTTHQIATTLKASDNRNNHRLPELAPVQFDCESESSPPLHPYVLGSLLGDGGFTNSCVSFTNPETDVVRRIVDLLPEADILTSVRPGLEYRIKRRQRNNGTSETRVALDGLGLYGKGSKEKFIPECYLRGSVQTRLELLRGLFDTDGHVSKASRCLEFTTSSAGLASGVAFVVRSLGGRVATTTRTPTFTYKGERREGALSYRMQVAFRNGLVPVSSEKHLSRWAPVEKSYHLSLESVEYVGKKVCQCIRVNAPDALYVTDDFILTHNSTLALNISANVGRYFLAQGNKRRVGVVSREMSVRRLVKRLHASAAQIEARVIRSGMYQSDLEMLIRTIERLRELPLDFDTTTSNIYDIRRNAREHHRRGGLGCLVVDLIQLCDASTRDKRVESRRVEVEDISRTCKNISVDFQIPVLAVSHLSRNNAKEHRAPELHDLKEAGAIEQDAGLVLFLHDPKPEENAAAPTCVEMELIIAKQRDGWTGKIETLFNKPMLSFYTALSVAESSSFSEGGERAWEM